jgi:L-serine deaminase
MHVRRRAAELHRNLSSHPEAALRDPLSMLDWVNLYAMAVNEENAAGGRVVTAPTNGAAGSSRQCCTTTSTFLPGANDAGIATFLLTAGAIGIIYKVNASLSGAEVGCQGEVGVACSMAAGALAAVMGGTPEQVENAAEIGMEHNLGMTCDPVGGLVQIPCIERNAMGAIKAINAARMALRGDGQHVVSLDKVIKTMMQTGADMKSQIQGNLARRAGRERGGVLSQALAVGRAIVQRGIAGCAELRGGKRANGAGLQRVVGHHAEGGVQAQLGELGVGRNRNLGDVLGRIDGRGLNAHARIEVANDRHHPGIHQLLGHLLAGGRVGLVVHRHHFQLHALAIDHEAIAVQFFHRQVHAVEQVLPQRPKGPLKGCATPILIVSGTLLQPVSRPPAAQGARARPAEKRRRFNGWIMLKTPSDK